MSRFLGGLLLAAGVLIAGLSGLCTCVFGIPWILSATTIPRANTYEMDLPSVVEMVLAFGGIPFVAGLGLIFGGRSLMRRGSGGRKTP